MTGRTERAPETDAPPWRRGRCSVAVAAAAVAVAFLSACGRAGTAASPAPDPAGATSSPHSAPIFAEVSGELGFSQDPTPWPDGTYRIPEMTGGGVALLDYDNDGHLDILRVQVPLPGAADPRSLNRLYHQGVDGRFVDVTESAGLRTAGFGQGVAVGDADNDGFEDLYFTNYGPDTYYRNNGDGTFTDLTAAAGFTGSEWSSSATFCDYDSDADLDLYVVHYLRFDPDAVCSTRAGQREYCGPATFPGVPDKLYRNDGDGTFTDVTVQAGLVLPEDGLRARGLGVVALDLTGDGRPDFYVANDGESNQLWVNRGDGTFAEEGLLRGVAVNAEGRPEAGMGVAVGDVDGHGMASLFVTNLRREHDDLYVPVRAGLFLDRIVESGIGASDLDHTGFGCALFDFDLDGDLDLAIANG